MAPASLPVLIGMVEASVMTSLCDASTRALIAWASRHIAKFTKGVGIPTGGTRQTSGTAMRIPPSLVATGNMRQPNRIWWPSMVTSSSEVTVVRREKS